MDLGFSSHAFHASSRLVFMEATLSSDRKSLSISSPPNNRVFPPGPGALCLSITFLFISFLWFPGFIFLTIDGVTSEGSRLMVGNGVSPPVSDQGIPLSIPKWYIWSWLSGIILWFPSPFVCLFSMHSNASISPSYYFITVHAEISFIQCPYFICPFWLAHPLL